MKGIWIPIEVLKMPGLSASEKMMLAEIIALSKGRACTASNAHFSDLFGFTKRNCTRLIRSLEDKNLIKIKIKRKGKLVVSRQITTKKRYCQSDSTGDVNLTTGYCQSDNRVLSKVPLENTLENTLEEEEAPPQNQKEEEQEPYTGGGKIALPYRVKQLFLKHKVTVLEDDMKDCASIAFKMRDAIMQHNGNSHRPADDRITQGVSNMLDKMPAWVKEKGYFSASFINRKFSSLYDEIRKQHTAGEVKRNNKIQHGGNYA